VKWLASITVIDEPFAGYQHTAAYRLRVDEDDEGHPVTRMQPRALMLPPGIPDFHSRVRTLAPGRHVLEGRAWSGWAPVTRVEVSANGGETWRQADLEPAASQWGWRRWSYDWDAQEEGDYLLSCRAEDEAGNAQPDEPSWNVGGYSNNALQRVPVTVQKPGYDQSTPE
jgi:hypothetical protein